MTTKNIGLVLREVRMGELQGNPCYILHVLKEGKEVDIHVLRELFPEGESLMQGNNVSGTILRMSSDGSVRVVLQPVSRTGGKE